MPPVRGSFNGEVYSSLRVILKIQPCLIRHGTASRENRKRLKRKKKANPNVISLRRRCCSLLLYGRALSSVLLFSPSSVDLSFLPYCDSQTPPSSPAPLCRRLLSPLTLPPFAKVLGQLFSPFSWFNSRPPGGATDLFAASPFPQEAAPLSFFFPIHTSFSSQLLRRSFYPISFFGVSRVLPNVHTSARPLKKTQNVFCNVEGPSLHHIHFRGGAFLWSKV